MPAQDDLKGHALSTTDFYDLLSLPATVAPGDIKSLERAWRKTALKYHPDKVGPNDEVAKEKFHLANIGFEVLRDPTLRELYDRTRAARLQKERQRALLAEGKRKAREDLEAREAGAKRSADVAFGRSGHASTGSTDDETQLEREIRRLAADGRRRREERMEELRREEREREETEKRRAREAEQEKNQDGSMAGVYPPTPDSASLIASVKDRTVKARFSHHRTTRDLDRPKAEALFSEAFGPVELALVDHRQGDETDKVANSTGTGHSDQDRGSKLKSKHGGITVVFASLLGAHAAVNKWECLRDAALRGDSNADPTWQHFKSVKWKGGKEPAAVQAWVQSGGTASTSASTRTRDLDQTSNRSANPHSRQSTATTDASTLDLLKGTKPSFGFSAKSAAAPATDARAVLHSPFAVQANGSPSLEELTLMRLRHAEKRRVEVEALRGDELLDGER